MSLPQGRLQYFRRGEGPVVVFAHGWLANANLWRNVVDSPRRSLHVHRPRPPARRPPRRDGRRRGPQPGRLRRPDRLGAGGARAPRRDARGQRLRWRVLTDRASPLTPGASRGWCSNSCETPYSEFPPAPFDGLPAGGKGCRERSGAARGPARPRDPRRRRPLSACSSSTRSTTSSPTPTRCRASASERCPARHGQGDVERDLGAGAAGGQATDRGVQAPRAARLEPRGSRVRSRPTRSAMRRRSATGGWC